MRQQFPGMNMRSCLPWLVLSWRTTGGDSIFFANGLDLPWERAPTWDPAVFEIVDSALTA